MSSQTKIKSIKVENVRGIASKTFVFDTPEMLANKFHLLVAPNGFGKSSLAGAFESLKPRSLKLPEILHHKDDPANKPRLEICYSVNGVEQTVVADEKNNGISGVFSIAVINSKLRPRAVSRSGFKPYLKPSSFLEIKPTVLVEKVPRRPSKDFSTSAFKKAFGPCGKILPSIQPMMENARVLKGILDLPEIAKFGQKSVWKRIEPTIADINSQSGTIESVLAWVEENKLGELQAIPELAAIVSVFDDFSAYSETQKYFLAYQFAKAFEDDPTLLYRHRDWRGYLAGKRRCEDLLNSVNSNPEWVSVTPKETEGELIVEFPEASKMSNGQRDLFSFVTQLMKAEFEFEGKRAILIVDEVFDYLDECNLLAAQYYISQFIARFKAEGTEIFPLFLTHLDPHVFKHSVLGLGKSDIRKVHLLDKASDTSRRVGIAAMVKLREHASLKPYIAKHFFHYHPLNCDQVALFKEHSLKESWGKSHDFYRYTFGEFAKYRSGDSEADHVAACVAARIAIEKAAFDQLKSTDKSRFTEEFNKRTSDKLDFVEQLGGRVPESHRLLGLLYNDILHHKDHFDYISAIVSKMKNPAIRGMMGEIPIPKTLEA